MVLVTGWEFYVPIPRQQEEQAGHSRPGLSLSDLKGHPLVPHCQQSHTYSNKVTFSDSATPCGSMGAIFFQTTIDTIYLRMKEKEDT